MKSEEKKILGIVRELLSNSLSANAKEINIRISREGDTFIEIEDNGRGMDGETLDYVKRVLKQPHRRDMESYYGELAGSSSEGSGLNLVGFLVDEAEVESSEDGTSIRVKRYI